MRLQSTEGQGMAEFALILPLLALLTFGTIEVGVYLQQQSTLNAAAYISARSASVLGNQKGPTKQSAELFATEAGAGWLSSAIQSMKQDEGSARAGAGQSHITLLASTDKLSGMIDALTSGQSKGLDKLGAQASFPLEYDSKRFGEKSVTSVQRTMYLVSYESTNFMVQPDPSLKARDDIAKAKQVLLKLLAIKITPAPAPKPAAGGTTKKPAGGTTGGTPAKGGGTKGGGTKGGGAKPAPAPVAKPTVPTTPFAIPYLSDITNFAQDTSVEPFRTVGAVIPNPHHRRDAGDGNQFTSSEYLATEYESHFNNDAMAIGRGAYRIQNMMAELDDYISKLDGGKSTAAGGAAGASGAVGKAAKAAAGAAAGSAGFTLNNGSIALGNFDAQKAALAAGAAAPAAEAIALQVNAAKKAAANAGLDFATQTDKAYLAKDKAERELFK